MPRARRNEEDRLAANMTSIATLDKLREYPQIVERHIEIVHEDYTVVEMNAGCGFDVDKETGAHLLGTPILAGRVMENYQNILNCKLVAVEKVKKSYELLAPRLSPVDKIAVGIINGDNREDETLEVVHKLVPSERGLIFHDPFGAPDPDVIAKHHKLLPKFDLLIRLNAKQCAKNYGRSLKPRIKRNGEPFKVNNPLSLHGIIVKNPQFKYWLVSEPKHSLQWCWVFGTNNFKTFQYMARAVPNFELCSRVQTAGGLKYNTPYPAINNLLHLRLKKNQK